MRKFKSILFMMMSGVCALIACGLLVAVLAAIASRGLHALSWEFITSEMRQAGSAGGIYYHIIGTLILIGTALAVSLPIAVSLSLVQAVYLRHLVWGERLGALFYLLNGVPSLLFGLFGLIVFVQILGIGKSWLSGGIVLGMMMLPTTAIALTERISSLPNKYLEAATGLGLSKSQIIWSVIMPQSLSGVVTGSLLGLARAAGETAPIMFTATIFAGASIPEGIKESPVLSLPYHIFILAQDSFDPAVGEKLWGTALTLVGIAIILNLIALPLRLNIHEEARKA